MHVLLFQWVYFIFMSSIQVEGSSVAHNLSQTHSQKGWQSVSLLHGCSQPGVRWQSLPRQKVISPPSWMYDEACDLKFAAAQSRTKNAERRRAAGDGRDGTQIVRHADIVWRCVTERGRTQKNYKRGRQNINTASDSSSALSCTQKQSADHICFSLWFSGCGSFKSSSAGAESNLLFPPASPCAPARFCLAAALSTR